MGIGISGLCAIHCLFFPVALALLPLWPVGDIIHDWTHPILFVLIVPTVVFAIKHGYKVPHVPLLLYSGLIIVGLAWLLHGWLGSWGEALVTLAGSALLVAGHWKNYIYHKNHLHLQHETT